MMNSHWIVPMNGQLRSSSIVLLCAPLLWSSAFSRPGDSLTVRDAVELVLARNPALAEASHAIAAAHARVGLSRGGYMPKADIEASYTLLEPVAQIEFGGAGFDLYPANNYDAHVGIQQPIFDFSRTGSQVDLAESRVALAEDARAQVRRDLAYRTIESFYSILLLRRSVEVQDEQVRTLSQHLSATQKRIASGTATQLDALTTQVRVADAQTRMISLQNALRNAETGLRRLVAVPQDTVLNLTGEFSAPSMTLERDSLEARALRDRIESGMADHEVESARAQERSARLSDMPSLSAFAAYGVKNGYFPNLNVMRGNLAAGARLTIPILDARRSGSMTEEASALLRAAEERKRSITLTILAEVHAAADDLAAAQEKLRVSEVTIERAEKAMENARLKYEAGTVQNIDVLDAATERAQAKLSNLQSVYDVIVSTYRLRRAIGSPALGQ